ncbi:MAG: isochorismatase family protein [Syntrophorhabdaceae bacterium]|nr:isochorismatase family protein [Syntrophorhabdaceae bacterium]MDD4195025.1 isochorismatase family protein [Syntrophorhabdaceae bacterium]
MPQINPAQHLVKREDCVLVAIDVQEKLVPAVDDGEQVIRNTVRLVKFCAIAGIPAVFTEQQKLGPTLAAVREAAGNFAAIEKVHFNCFMNPQFSEKINSLGRNTIVITGAESHICIAQTALTALANRRVHVISDAVSSRSPANKAVSLARMRDAGAVISSTEMFIYEILVQGGTDEFRSVLPLVK